MPEKFKKGMSKHYSNQLCSFNCGCSAYIPVRPRERRLVSAQSRNWRSSRTPWLHLEQCLSARSCIDLLVIAEFLSALAPLTPQVLSSFTSRSASLDFVVHAMSSCIDFLSRNVSFRGLHLFEFIELGGPSDPDFSFSYRMERRLSLAFSFLDSSFRFQCQVVRSFLFLYDPCIYSWR